MNPNLRLRASLALLLLAALACTAPGMTAQPNDNVSLFVTQTLKALSATPPTKPSLETPYFPSTTALAPTYTPGVIHLSFPADIVTNGPTLYDVSSRDTAPEHRAPYGDSYKLNRFERPFTANEMDYLPDVDILTYRISADQNWYYIFIQVAGSGMTGDYGVEFDFDRDGDGDYLIWVTPPIASSWTTDGVIVYTDSNNDTGGLSPEFADANFSGDGYDQTLIYSGRGGADPDLAWARIDPRSTSTIQFAVKRSLLGGSFLWSAWADLGLRDPRRFSYNDYFTEEEAGSPEKSEVKFYPIKAIYAVDNTCRAPYGFRPKGYEPLICPEEDWKNYVPTPTPVH
ncbi:MAG: hypothetical protein AB1750_03905 [Chloroflexota bacterium]